MLIRRNSLVARVLRALPFRFYTLQTVRVGHNVTDWMEVSYVRTRTP